MYDLVEYSGGVANFFLIYIFAILVLTITITFLVGFLTKAKITPILKALLKNIPLALFVFIAFVIFSFLFSKPPVNVKLISQDKIVANGEIEGEGDCSFGEYVSKLGDHYSIWNELDDNSKRSKIMTINAKHEDVYVVYKDIKEPYLETYKEQFVYPLISLETKEGLKTSYTIVLPSNCR